MRTTMNVSCDITELGPVRNSRIDFNHLMFFTGGSNLGKSYTAFLIYYFFTIFTSHRGSSFFDSKLKNGRTSIKFKPSEFREWMNNDVSSYIGYLIGDSTFQCKVNFIFLEDDDPIEMELKLNRDSKKSSDINSLVDGTYSVRTNQKDEISFSKNTSTAVAFNHSFAHFILNETSNIHPFYNTIILPPARAALMGANYTFQESIVSNVGMYKEFIKSLDFIRQARPYRKKEEQDSDHVEEAISRLTSCKLASEKDEIFLLLKNGKKLPISAAASSVKELSPLLLLLQNWDVSQFSVLFEEPEAHLHPLNQNIVLDLIARSVNRGALFQITTHSDYLLARVNQLIRIGNIKKRSTKLHERFCKEHKISKDLFLDSDMVGAYYFKEGSDGFTAIEKQETNEGIPFKTFSEIVDEQYRVDEAISEYLEME